MLNVAMLSYWHVHAEGYARELTEAAYISYREKRIVKIDEIE